MVEGEFTGLGEGYEVGGYDGGMLGWLIKEKRVPREALLGAIPVRNALVREKREGKDLRLIGPVKSGWRRMMGAGGEKMFELDELGAFVWEGIDGKCTVEGAIRRFATEKRVNLREAEVAVLAFLQTLLLRGLVALVARAEA